MRNTMCDLFFFFNDTATAEISPLPLHAALPICHAGTPSLPQVHRSIAVPRGDSRSDNARRVLAFAGPGYMVAVGYMDPGNWATSIAGGSQFGYSLLAVIFASNLMAMLFQIGRAHV